MEGISKVSLLIRMGHRADKKGTCKARPERRLGESNPQLALRRGLLYPFN